MEHTHAPIQADFFLGCLSPTGFRGYFHELARQPGLALWLIKAGPGCGKSTLMKQLAARGRGGTHPLLFRPGQPGRCHLLAGGLRHCGRHRAPRP